MSDAPTLLAARYGGVVASRAFWIWAGGRGADVAPSAPAAERWNGLWARAGEEGAPSAIAILRQALFDAPGDATLLALLTAHADTASPGASTVGRGAAEAVAAWESGLDTGALDAALGNLAGHPDAAFAALAAALDGRIGPRRRKDLCDLAVDAATPTATALRDALHGTLPDPDPDPDADEDADADDDDDAEHDAAAAAPDDPA